MIPVAIYSKTNHGEYDLHEIGVGTTVETREHYIHDEMYDVTATSWDAERDQFVTITYTGGYPEMMYRHGRATIDAPEALVEAFKAWQGEQRAAHQAWCRAQETLTDLHYVAKGAPVKVVKGRKVPVGTTGECFWIGEGTWGTRVGLRDEAGETHWTAITNVERILDEPTIAVAERAATTAREALDALNARRVRAAATDVIPTAVAA